MLSFDISVQTGNELLFNVVRDNMLLEFSHSILGETSELDKQASFVIGNRNACVLR